MKKIYIRERYNERDDWACPSRERFIQGLEFNCLNGAKAWILSQPQERISKLSIVECEETEYFVETIVTLKPVQAPGKAEEGA